MKQRSLASQSMFEKYGRKSRRELFIDEIERIVPWAELLALVEPYYAKAGKGRQPGGFRSCSGLTSCSSGSHPRAFFDQERKEATRFGDAPDEEGQPQQELIRHALIQTTMDVYGQAMPASRREAKRLIFLIGSFWEFVRRAQSS